MIPNLGTERENFQAKQEGDDQNANNNQTLILKPQPSTPNSSRQWTTAFRNPRIVRASRCFGGKDRHSKVCTVRGLRDRRIRLSVQTAVQLYDLQDRLGLNQPSKVVDWLLDAAKDDVDKLPPLQFPQGFDRLYQNMGFGSNDVNQNWDKFSSSFDLDQSSSRQDLEIGGSSLRPRNSKDVEKLDGFGLEKGKWIKEVNDDVHDDEHDDEKIYPNLINNPTMSFNPYHHQLDPSHLSLSQLGHTTYLSQPELSVNTSSNTSYPVMNNVLPSGSSQLFLYPSSGYPQLNQYFQLSNSNPQQIFPNSNSFRPFHQLMNVNPGFGDMDRDRNNDNDDSDS